MSDLLTAATEQNYLDSVMVNGQSLGVFDTFSGGDALAKEVKHRPGGMGSETLYASLPSYTTVTMSRVLEPARDWELIRGLLPLAGRCQASVTRQPLDATGSPWGSPIVYKGGFLGVKPGKDDSTSENVQMFEIDISVNVIA